MMPPATPTDAAPAPFAPIWLASRSPRRRELLAQLGVVHDLLLFDIDETPAPGEDPQAYVQRIARSKAETGGQELKRRGLEARPVLAADTSVIIDGHILGKPGNAERAEIMLRQLSGHSHQVMTAVALAWQQRVHAALSISTVTFAELEEDDIHRYAHSGEPLDKAGGYAIQGQAAAFIRHLSGSYSGVMGLPAFETVQLLRATGLARA